MKIKRVFAGLFLLAGVEALGALVYLLLLPADPKNAVLWGYSVARLIMAVGLLAVAAGCVLAGLFSWRRYDRVERVGKWLSEKPVRLWSMGVFLGAMTIAAWVTVWLPGYRFGNTVLLYQRFLPLLVWVGLSCGQGLLAFFIWRGVLNFRRFWQSVQSEKGLWWFVVGGLSLFALVQVTVTQLGFLTTHDSMQYNPPGAPVLPLQVMIVWLVSILTLVFTGYFQRRNWEKKDWGIFILVWVIAAIFWIQTPMQPTYFAPAPRPPDGILFPYSDAALYDRTAQFALMGLGLRNGGYVDKPLYSSFLTVLHLIGGQNYDLITAMQAAVFALLPALAYAMGRRLYGRAAGIAAAAIVIFRGVNAIAGGHWIQTAHARLLLSEMPTALALAFLVYFLVRWFADPRGHLFPVLAGGALGLSTLIRHNPWFLVPVIVLAAVFVYWRQWNRWLAQVSLFGLAMLMVIAPWMYYSQKTVGTPWYFMIPLRGVVWKGRLQPEIEEGGFVPATERRVLASSSAGVSATGGILLSQSGSVLPEVEKSAIGITRVVQILSAHLYNNFRGSLLILPATGIADDLDHTLSAPTSIWQGGWTEGVSGWMAVNVCLILIGIGAAWKKLRIAGIVPFIVFSGYLLAVSVARTSGGRYLVPVDWVVLLYYAVGIAQVCVWMTGISSGSNQQDESLFSDRPPALQWVRGVLGMLLVVGMIPYVQEAIPRDFLSNSEGGLPSAEWMMDAGLDPLAVDEFLKRDGAVVRYGQVLYPRFYGWKEGESLGCYGARPYPRLVFELIGEEGVDCVTVPYPDLSNDVPLHSSAAIVLGCEGGGDWVVMFPEKDFALTRFTQTDAPTCPLRYPICADNRNCK